MAKERELSLCVPVGWAEALIEYEVGIAHSETIEDIYLSAGIRFRRTDYDKIQLTTKSIGDKTKEREESESLLPISKSEREDFWEALQKAVVTSTDVLYIHKNRFWTNIESPYPLLIDIYETNDLAFLEIEFPSKHELYLIKDYMLGLGLKPNKESTYTLVHTSKESPPVADEEKLDKLIEFMKRLQSNA